MLKGIGLGIGVTLGIVLTLLTVAAIVLLIVFLYKRSMHRKFTLDLFLKYQKKIIRKKPLK